MDFLPGLAADGKDGFQISVEIWVMALGSLIIWDKLFQEQMKFSPGEAEKKGKKHKRLPHINLWTKQRFTINMALLWFHKKKIFMKENKIDNFENTLNWSFPNLCKKTIMRK